MWHIDACSNLKGHEEGFRLRLCMHVAVAEEATNSLWGVACVLGGRREEGGKAKKDCI